MANEERKQELYKLLEAAERENDFQLQIELTQELVELNSGGVK